MYVDICMLIYVYRYMYIDMWMSIYVIYVQIYVQKYICRFIENVAPALFLYTISIYNLITKI